MKQLTGKLDQHKLAVRNLSLNGVCLEVDRVLKSGEELLLELSHPHLSDPASFLAKVAWFNENNAGLQFVRIGDNQRKWLRACMLAEYGHAVLKGKTVLGYLVSRTPENWSFYDSKASKLASLRVEKDRIRLLRSSSQGSCFTSFEKAAAVAFGLRALPRIHPRVEWSCEESPEQEESSLSGSCILDQGKTVGFVALTGEGVWSFFDDQQEPTGFMTRTKGEGWRIVLLGANDDGSLDLRQAETYSGALAAAFSLEAEPQVRSALIHAKSA